MVIRLLILGLLLFIGCKPVVRDESVEQRIRNLFAFKELASHGKCRKSDGWCGVYKKFRVSKEDYQEFVLRHKMHSSKGYPVVYDMRDDDGKLINNWLPGPGKPEDQINSGFLYFKDFHQNQNYPDSYIVAMHKDGFMYVNFFGFEETIIDFMAE